MEDRETEKGQEYLVYFANGQSAWCLKKDVRPGLLSDYIKSRQ